MLLDFFLVKKVKRPMTLHPLMLNQPFSFHILGKSCNGTNYDSECCSVVVPCAINKGDCDNEYECQGNLTCGSNNCPAPFPSGADCCESPFGKQMSW